MYNQEAFHSGKAIFIVIVLVPLLTYCLSMVQSFEFVDD